MITQEMAKRIIAQVNEANSPILPVPKTYFGLFA
jgi:hypothetical protein